MMDQPVHNMQVSTTASINTASISGFINVFLPRYYGFCTSPWMSPWSHQPFLVENIFGAVKSPKERLVISINKVLSRSYIQSLSQRVEL